MHRRMIGGSGCSSGSAWRLAASVTAAAALLPVPPALQAKGGGQSKGYSNEYEYHHTYRRGSVSSIGSVTKRSLKRIASCNNLASRTDKGYHKLSNKEKKSGNTQTQDTQWEQYSQRGGQGYSELGSAQQEDEFEPRGLWTKIDFELWKTIVEGASYLASDMLYTPLSEVDRWLSQLRKEAMKGAEEAKKEAENMAKEMAKKTKNKEATFEPSAQEAKFKPSAWTLGLLSVLNRPLDPLQRDLAPTNPKWKFDPLVQRAAYLPEYGYGDTKSTIQLAMWHLAVAKLLLVQLRCLEKLNRPPQEEIAELYSKLATTGTRLREALLSSAQ